MAKRKNSSRGSHKGLKIFLGILVVLGVGAGATAIATKGFKQFGEVEKYIKGGITVDTFTVDNLQKGTGVLTLIDKDDVTLTANIQGSTSDDEKLILGDKTEVAAMTKSELEEGLAIYAKLVDEDPTTIAYIRPDKLSNTCYIRYPGCAKG